MDQGFRNKGLNGPSLAGLLSQLALFDRSTDRSGGRAQIDAAAARPSFVDGMGQWLGWADAIALSAALNAPLSHHAAAAKSRSPRPQASDAAVRREFDRVRTALAQEIAEELSDANFASHRRRYRALQQSMEAGIAPLRAMLRDALARKSPAMGRLAALDAVMDEGLREREQSVLAVMPTLLQRHFERLLAAHRSSAGALPAAPEGTPPDTSPPAGPWLVEFRRDMRRVLLAELELRLQPAVGLLEALQSEVTKVS